MVRGIGHASERKEMSGGGAGNGERNLDLPNKISLEALPVSLYYKGQAHNMLSWGSVVSNANIRYTLFCYRLKV